MEFNYDSGFNFSPEQSKAFSGMWSKLGKENASSTFPGTFGEGSGSQVPTWAKAFGLASSYLDKTRKDSEQENAMRKMPYLLGRGTEGFGGRILDNLGVYQGPQQGPIFIPGAETQGGGKGSKIGALAGTVLGAFIGGPAGATIGGSLGSAGGSFFD